MAAPNDLKIHVSKTSGSCAIKSRSDDNIIQHFETCRVGKSDENFNQGIDQQIGVTCMSFHHFINENIVILREICEFQILKTCVLIEVTHLEIS